MAGLSRPGSGRAATGISVPDGAQSAARSLAQTKGAAHRPPATGRTGCRACQRLARRSHGRRATLATPGTVERSPRRTLAQKARSPYAAPLRRPEPGTDRRTHGRFGQHGGKAHRFCLAALQAATSTRTGQGAARMTRLSDIDTCDIEASDSIDAQAASWFARNRNDTARADRKAFAAWQSEPAHARAYAEFEQLWADLAQLQQLNKPTPLPIRKTPVWRPALAVAAALVCAVLATPIGAPRELYHSQVAAHAKGMRTLNLPDGSTLYVNANTRLRVDFSAHQRILHLDKGQLYIEVAAD